MNIHDKQSAASAIDDAAAEFNDERENAEQYLADIDELRDTDFTSDLDGLDEDALAALQDQVPSSSDLSALRDTVNDMIRSAEKFEAAVDEAAEYLDTEYEVVVVFTVKANSEDEATTLVERSVGTSYEYEVEETREA